MAVDADLPRIPEFYKDKTIFITGFTGFMGKVLVEKILWSCPEVKCIYVLLRSKRGLDFKQRLDKIINSDLFSRVRDERKEEMKKIVPLNGDVTLPELGLSSEHTSLLKTQVNILFHCAASVKFDDPLPDALDINVKGTKTVIDLALEMSKLVSFVHVSTAYSNCDRFDIEEKVYPPHADWRKTLEIREKVDNSIVNILSQKYMNHMPNTYVFAKSLGEHIVSDYADRLPIVIFRPSIVISTMDEPFRGWIDNLNGPTGLLAGYGTGVVRTCLLDSSVKPDFLPVDLAIRGLLVCAYTRVYKKDEGIQFYNWCSKDRSVTYEDLIQLGKRLIDDAPMKYVLWRPSTHTTASSTLFYINFILFQMIPAFFIDLFLRIIGKKPMLWKIQKKIYIALRALSYFTLNYFHFHNQNGYDIVEYIKEEDDLEFRYVKRPEEVDNYQYFLNATKYFQQRFMKMKQQDREFAHKMRSVLYIADLIAKNAFWLFLAWTVYSYELIPRMFNGTLEYLLNF